MRLGDRIRRLEAGARKSLGKTKYAACREEFEAMQREIAALSDAELDALNSKDGAALCDPKEKERLSEMTDFELFCHGCQEKGCELTAWNRRA